MRAGLSYSDKYPNDFSTLKAFIQSVTALIEKLRKSFQCFTMHQQRVGFLNTVIPKVNVQKLCNAFTDEKYEEVKTVVKSNKLVLVEETTYKDLCNRARRNDLLEDLELSTAMRTSPLSLFDLFLDVEGERRADEEKALKNSQPRVFHSFQNPGPNLVSQSLGPGKGSIIFSKDDSDFAKLLGKRPADKASVQKTKIKNTARAGKAIDKKRDAKKNGEPNFSDSTSGTK